MKVLHTVKEYRDWTIFKQMYEK